MTKQTIIIVALILLLVGGGRGGAIWWQRYKTTIADDSSSSASQALAHDADKETPQTKAATSESRLKTSDVPDSSSLGQLDATNGQTTSRQQNSSAQKSMLDPSNFAQYEKYKNGQSGLFAEIQKGTGTELTRGKTAAVLYKGWLTNGTLFDQSRKNEDGKLVTFNFELGKGQVIAGWEQGLAGMKEGGVRLVIVPPAAGYGASEKENIPANSVLVFQVQLISVQ